MDIRYYAKTGRLEARVPGEKIATTVAVSENTVVGLDAAGRVARITVEKAGEHYDVGNIEMIEPALLFKTSAMLAWHRLTTNIARGFGRLAQPAP